MRALRAAIREVAAVHPERAALIDERATRTYGELATLLEPTSGAPHRREVISISGGVGDVENIVRLGWHGHTCLVLDAKTRNWEAERARSVFTQAVLDADGARPALALTTSGSTGFPKIVELDWETLLENAGSFARTAGYTGADTVWCTTPIAHPYALGTGVFGGLLSGATVLLTSGMLPGAAFAEQARAQGATFVLSVPFLYRRYLEDLSRSPDLVRSWRVKCCVAAGEPVAAELIADWKDVTGVHLLSHYGLTEAGHLTLGRGRPDEGVGRPLPGVDVRIDDGGLVRVRQRPPLRPYRVVGRAADPDGWCDTGDIGHLDPDGNLHITGRADQRINIAGKKIDPAEVETALLSCAGVADCAVASAGGDDVTAFVRLADDSVTDGALRIELAGRVSAYKLPRRFVRVEEIPRTLTGKIRRGDLLATLADRADAGDTGAPLARRLAEAHASERQGIVLELVRSEAAGLVVGRREAAAVEPERSFQDLGFTSLTALELSKRLSDVSGVRVPQALAFDYPTPAEMANWLLSQLHVAEHERADVTATTSTDDPIAIVGMGCRFPGGIRSPADLWNLVAAGGDAISAFPDDRGWHLDGLYDSDPDAPGKSYARAGGFVDGAPEFDAGFFEISPREALAMDPQQRLLLEVAWETLEDAGVDPTSLRGSPTGVFTGVMSPDYGRAHGSPELDAQLATGLAASVASGRIAFVLGLEGPALSIDTACSSSLVALHLACQALRSGECSLALAGGATVMATPETFVRFSRQRALAPDGRCKPFAAAADGTGFSEGAGMVLVERLSDARRCGHRVLALVRGSAVNQDGRSNGLTAPNGRSQERLIRQALANAGVRPADVDAVEAHGTGTRLGDPIEAQAVLATYGQERRDAPLWLGSIKSNIGHAQAAAGIAGVIKLVMAMRHGVLPRTLHVDQPTAYVDWSAGDVALLTDEVAWPPASRPRRAAVSSFGISGTNAHVILEDTPPPEPVTSRDEPGLPAVAWLLSATSEAMVGAQAEQLRSHLLQHPELAPEDVGFTLATCRAQLEHRAAVLGSSRDELLAGLDALIDGRPAAGVARGIARSRKVAFVFPGQGAQWPEMARALLADSAVFAEQIHACDDALKPYLEFSIEDVLRGVDGAPSLERVDVVQPALFAVMVSLARLWRRHGVEPSAVVGHSQGEIAAACVADALSLQDAARVVALRSQALAGLAGRGGMVAMSLAPEQAAERIERWNGRLAIAALNGACSVVVSGDRQALDELCAACDAEGVRARRIAVDYASHSAEIEAVEHGLISDLAPIQARTGAVPFYSTATGGRLDGTELGPEYWYRSLRDPVLFEPTTRRLLEHGFTAFVEVSAHPVLSMPLQETIEATAAASDSVAVIGTLRRGEGGGARFMRSLADAHVQGVKVSWDAAFTGAAPVELPTYAFERRRYWLETSPAVDHPPVLTPAAREPAGFGSLAARLAGVPDAERADAALDLVRAEVAAVLGHSSAEAVAPEREFRELGLDSAGAVELRHRLSRLSGVELPAALIFDCPTAAAVATDLLERSGDARPASPVAAA